MFGSSKATRLKNESEERRRAGRRRAPRRRRRQPAEAGDAFREELVTCAAEAILSLRPEDEEAKAGWCQVALEASATLRSAALRRDPSAAGSRTTGNRSRNRSSSRRAASDASLRLIARLCAATKAAASEGSRPEAPGTHKAALRVLAALVQESGSSEYSGGPPDDAALAGVAWVACRHVELPVGDAANAPPSAPRGPLGRAIAAIVRDLCAGGAGRAFAERRNAAAQREAGTLHAPEEDEDGPARGRRCRPTLRRRTLVPTGRGRVRHRRGGARVRRDSVRQVPLDVRRHGADAGRAHPRGRRGGVRGARPSRV